MSLRSYEPFTHSLRRYVDVVSRPADRDPATQDATLAEVAAQEDALFATAEAYVAGSVAKSVARLGTAAVAVGAPDPIRLRIAGRRGITELFDAATGVVTLFCEKHRHEFSADRTCYLCNAEDEKRLAVASGVAKLDERRAPARKHVDPWAFATLVLFTLCSWGLVFNVCRAIWLHFQH